MARIVFVGEAMVEHRGERGQQTSGYGGDTFNTAVHLSRLGHEVAFLTAIGCDPASDALSKAMSKEGIDVSLVLRHPDCTVGSYSIRVDQHGERSFSYRRAHSAAREMFSLPGIDRAMDALKQADLIGYSLITLAIIPAAARARLLAEPGNHVFDGNYRPSLWSSRTLAADVRDQAVSRARFGLPTLEDEQKISVHADADSVAGHWQRLGCAETIVKLGGQGCRLPDGSICATNGVLSPVDTTGAGDAFNAGYIHKRLRNRDCEESAIYGHFIARQVILMHGATPPVIY